MGIRKLFHRNENLQTGRRITLEQAKKYEKDKKYKDCIFPVEGMENGKVMCRIQRVQRKENDINLNKNKREASFEKYVIAGGEYKGIDRNVKRGKTETSNTVSYNNWQSAKRYNPEAYTRD